MRNTSYLKPRTNSFPSHNKNTKAYKIVVYIYKLLHVLFGLNFGFFYNEFYKKVLNTISIFQSITLSVFAYIYRLNNDFGSNFELVSYLTNYVIYVITLSFFNRNSFFDLLCDLQEIDSKIGVSFNTELKLLVTALFIVIYRICFYVIYNMFDNYFDTIQLISVLCLDIVLLTYSFVFYSVFGRMKKFRVVLETANSDFVSFQHVYKSIVDVLEKYKAAFDYVFIISLFFLVPDVMVTIYSLLWDLERPKTLIFSLFMSAKCTDVLTILVAAFIPAIYAGMTASEARNIILILHEKKLARRDASQIREINRFIGYVEARPCRLRVFKLIPLDADLISMVLHFCVTYLIVIIQFTRVK